MEEDYWLEAQRLNGRMDSCFLEMDFGPEFEIQKSSRRNPESVGVVDQGGGIVEREVGGGEKCWILRMNSSPKKPPLNSIVSRKRGSRVGV